MAEFRNTAIKRPRPFSLAVGVMFLIVGGAAVISGWNDVEVGAVGAIALLVGGAVALLAFATRRAPEAGVGPE